MLLTDFDALTFDCHGTLIDWEGGMVEALKGLSDRVKRPLTRDQILEAHARHESSQQKYTPAKRYQDLLPIVYKRLAEEWGVQVSYEDCLEYGRSVGNWPAFEDSPGALQYLKKYFKLVILSNVDNEAFRASNRRLQVEFDAIYTAEDIGSYKPSPRNFDYMIEKLGEIGVKKEKVLRTAESMFHDHRPAVAWISEDRFAVVPANRAHATTAVRKGHSHIAIYLTNCELQRIEADLGSLSRFTVLVRNNNG